MKMINWIKIALIALILIVLAVVGGWLFLNKTEAGQKIMARFGRDATSAALWAVGEERLNRGDIDGAIADFEKAKLQDESEGVVDVDGLLMLGNAYESAGDQEAAAAS